MVWFLVSVAAVFVIGLTTQSRWFNRAHQRRSMLHRLSGLAAAEQVGQVVTPEGLSAPVSGRPCVYWRLHVERWAGQIESAAIEKRCDFWLDGAEAGRLKVKAKDLVFDAPADTLAWKDDDPRVAAAVARFGWKLDSRGFILRESIIALDETAHVIARRVRADGDPYRTEATDLVVAAPDQFVTKSCSMSPSGAEGSARGPDSASPVSSIDVSPRSSRATIEFSLGLPCCSPSA